MLFNLPPTSVSLFTFLICMPILVSAQVTGDTSDKIASAAIGTATKTTEHQGNNIADDAAVADIGVSNTQASCDTLSEPYKHTLDKADTNIFKNALNKQGIFSLPTQAGFFTKKLGFEPRTTRCETCKQGFGFEWKDKNDVSLKLYQEKKGNDVINMTYFGEKTIKDMPLGLILNYTDSYEATCLFKKYNPVRYQDSYKVSDTSNMSYTVVEFNQNNLLYKLAFNNSDDKLFGIIISSQASK